MSPDPSLPLDRELDRLLGEIHLRIRQGRYTEAEERIAQAQALAPEYASVVEAEGDLAFAKRKFKQAENLYRAALVLDPTDDKLEEKYALSVVKVHEPEIVAHIIPGDDSLWSNRVPRPPVMSSGLSAILPGLGQWYNGDMLKAVGLIVAWLLLFFGQLGAALGGLKSISTGGGNPLAALFSGWNIALLILAFALWAYAVADAYLIAVRTNEEMPAFMQRKPKSPQLPVPPTRPKKR